MAYGQGPNWGAYLGLGLNFGITMAASIFLGSKAGMWIDEKLNLPPIFTFLGFICGVITGFKVLFENINHLDKKRKY